MSSTATANVRLDNAVVTGNAPAPLPVFSQAIKSKNLIHVSGNVGMDPSTQELVPGGVKAQTAQILKNLQAVLEAAGSGIGKVVKVNVYITDMRNFAEMNEAYLGFFQDPQPVSLP
ncbi:endoribonuclease L-PSP [Capronia epimyces CBS 606.96]|uniref:Endoribonuclease L-PSP n=1 Tax=Capronia epimyces CBS 606.96 TaxID=1182542 RepID=W9YCR3_9EURO|nr:endoribonuclease L-PSP [Capronia epimyces CBS 606.96]EXJ87440.1 endoribonuclease L-PSP [Capronia epimyces CBS 606.96]